MTRHFKEDLPCIYISHTYLECTGWDGKSEHNKFYTVFLLKNIDNEFFYSTYHGSIGCNGIKSNPIGPFLNTVITSLIGKLIHSKKKKGYIDITPKSREQKNLIEKMTKMSSIDDKKEIASTHKPSRFSSIMEE